MTNTLNLNHQSLGHVGRPVAPPGFVSNDAAVNHADNEGLNPRQSTACKTTSFNNLAMALGTGLAESMDHSTSDRGNEAARGVAPAIGVAGEATSAMAAMEGGAPGRINTPDVYARQSRHAVNRLLGNSGSGNERNPLGGSFDAGSFLNPSSFIPDRSNGTYQEDLKTGDGQRQLLGGTSFSSAAMNNNNQQVNNNHQLAPRGEKPMRYTAAMMAQQQQQQQPLMARGQLQQQQQQQGGVTVLEAGYVLAKGGSNNLNSLTPISVAQYGVTVVEPPSRNSTPAYNDMGTPRSRTGSISAAFGLNKDGLLYPLGVDDGRKSRDDSRVPSPPSQTKNASFAGAAPGFFVGGRASAPPSCLGLPATNFQPPGNVQAMRSYTVSSLQSKVAELHRELSGDSSAAQQGGLIGQQGGANVVQQGSVVGQQGGSYHAVAQQQQAVAAIRTVPAVPIVLTTVPAPHQSVLCPPSSLGVSRETSPNPGQLPGAQSLHAAVLALQMNRVDPEQLKREDAAAEDLAPFLKDASGDARKGSSSRGLAILHASDLLAADVRSMCEAFGSLESFRSDFGASRGVFFASYYDLRSAELAAAELPGELNKMANGGGRVQVKYCVPLSSSSSTDESMLLLMGLPGTAEEGEVNDVLSSFGQVRAIHYQASTTPSSNDEDLTSYLVEFYDVQDARQALLELEHASPWGETARSRVGTRPPNKRKLGKDLLMLMSGWRQRNVIEGPAGKRGDDKSKSLPGSSGSTTPQPKCNTTVSVSLTPSPSPPVHHTNMQEALNSQVTARMSHVQNSGRNQRAPAPHAQPQQPYYQYQAAQQYQIVVGPDGQYQYVPVQFHPQTAVYGQQIVLDPHTGQQIVYAPQQMEHHFLQQQQYQLHQQQYEIQPPQQQQLQEAADSNVRGYGVSSQVQVVAQQQQHAPPTQFIRLPAHQEVNSSSITSGRASLGSGGSSGGAGSSGIIPCPVQSRRAGAGGRAASSPSSSDTDLSLRLDRVRSGDDRRTSLMVRNIPNKYTRSMLLDEFDDVGHGPTKMDFFYLPIDFKNRCNRGYAFVNFVECADIVSFVEEYDSTKWKNFNSDKVCDVTYARIQGKAAMIRRFENSALMEKEEAYRPKVFVSYGDRKGEVEHIFPGAV